MGKVVLFLIGFVLIVIPAFAFGSYAISETWNFVGGHYGLPKMSMWQAFLAAFAIWFIRVRSSRNNVEL